MNSRIDSEALDQQAIDILRKNDRGGFTIPTARLYPYQWNWDSAFIALGFATFDLNRAWRELELLLEGQWSNGMVPHILFRQNDPDYFPGPSVWQTNDGPIPSGGISQPPVLASVVLSLLEYGGEDANLRAGEIFDALFRWHQWFHDQRTPESCPVVATVHPWESGRDNCPDWDIGLNAMEIHPDLEPYHRKDTEHADATQRPSKEQYDKYLTIVKFGRDHHWDQRVLTNQGPFLMADPGIHFILLRADKDLLVLARHLGRNDCVAQIESWIEAASAATNYLWNANVKAFCARDVRSGEFSNGFTSASALCFYAGVGSAEQRQGTLDNIDRVQSRVKFLIPSWDPDAAGFEPQRYWRGPVWPQMNNIIARGLAEQGQYQKAERIRGDLVALIHQSGFYECFNPVTGEGCIGADFSWTAAMWLAWASPRNTAAAA